MINIVLIEPQIPQNTGNIARTCAATGARLHLCGPMGFYIDDKKLKRAGLDYWNLLDISYYESGAEFFNKNPGGDFYFFTTKAEKTYCDASYKKDSFLIFGKETAGLDEELLSKNRERCLRIPMADEARSLNLSNSVAIAAYEAFRQLHFEGFKKKGELHRLSWE